jgi:hypothetical protein
LPPPNRLLSFHHGCRIEAVLSLIRVLPNSTPATTKVASC